MPRKSWNYVGMFSRKESELISPDFLEHLFGKAVSLPPEEKRSSRRQAELISPEFLEHLFGTKASKNA